MLLRFSRLGSIHHCPRPCEFVRKTVQVGSCSEARPSSFDNFRISSPSNSAAGLRADADHAMWLGRHGLLNVRDPHARTF
jgi:hypothetical protein